MSCPFGQMNLSTFHLIKTLISAYLYLQSLWLIIHAVYLFTYNFLFLWFDFFCLFYVFFLVFSFFKSSLLKLRYYICLLATFKVLGNISHEKRFHVSNLSLHEGHLKKSLSTNFFLLKINSYIRAFSIKYTF